MRKKKVVHLKPVRSPWTDSIKNAVLEPTYRLWEHAPSGTVHDDSLEWLKQAYVRKEKRPEPCMKCDKIVRDYVWVPAVDSTGEKGLALVCGPCFVEWRASQPVPEK